jgi:hypothetical protein
MSHRSDTGAMEYAYEQLREINNLREEMVAANNQCASMIETYIGSQCDRMYEGFFDDPAIQKRVGVFCTPNSVTQAVESFVDQMTYVSENIAVLSEQHIGNRNQEGAVALDFANLANFVSELEARTRQRPQRGLASEERE